MKNLEPQDLLRFVVPEDIALSPDGRTIYYVRQSIDVDDNRYIRCIMRIDRDTQREDALTQGSRDQSPTPSPDGRHVAFLRTTDEDIATAFVLSLQGGEPHPLTDWSQDAARPVWLPDGKRLVVEAALKDEQLPESLKQRRKADESRTPEDRHTRDVRVINRAFYRLDTHGYLDLERFTQLVELSLDGEIPPRVLTHGAYHHRQAAVHPSGHLPAY